MVKTELLGKPTPLSGIVTVFDSPEITQRSIAPCLSTESVGAMNCTWNVTELSGGTMIGVVVLSIENPAPRKFTVRTVSFVQPAFRTEISVSCTRSHGFSARNSIAESLVISATFGSAYSVIGSVRLNCESGAYAVSLPSEERQSHHHSAKSTPS